MNRVTLEVAGHPVALVDGTPSQGIGQLGPYAVYWNTQLGSDALFVAAVDDWQADGYGAVTWQVRRDRKTGHTRWVRVGDDG